MASLYNFTDEDYEQEFDTLSRELLKSDCNYDMLLKHATLLYLNCPRYMTDKFLGLIENIETRALYADYYKKY